MDADMLLCVKPDVFSNCMFCFPFCFFWNLYCEYVCVCVYSMCACQTFFDILLLIIPELPILPVNHVYMENTYLYMCIFCVGS